MDTLEARVRHDHYICHESEHKDTTTKEIKGFPFKHSLHTRLDASAVNNQAKTKEESKQENLGSIVYRKHHIAELKCEREPQWT